MKSLIKKILKEDNDWDWARESEPMSEKYIQNKLREFYIYENNNTDLIKKIHSLGLTKTPLDQLLMVLGRSMNNLRGSSYDSGYRDGYSDGQTRSSEDLEQAEKDGYSTGYREAEDIFYDKGYEEGWSEAAKEFYDKGYEEGSEETYYRAFEEGRAYEAGVDVEDLERRESGFDPKDYYDDYDENY
jgi:hypothetical protein